MTATSSSSITRAQTETVLELGKMSSSSGAINTAVRGHVKDMQSLECESLRSTYSTLEHVPLSVPGREIKTLGPWKPYRRRTLGHSFDRPEDNPTNDNNN